MKLHSFGPVMKRSIVINSHMAVEDIKELIMFVPGKKFFNSF